MIYGYMDVDGNTFTGESVRTGFEDMIEIYGLEWGTSRTVKHDQGYSTIEGLPQLTPVICYKNTDAASAYIAQSVIQAQNYATLNIHVIKSSGDEPIEYFTIELINATFISYNTINRTHSVEYQTYNPEGDSRQTNDNTLRERIEIIYDEITVRYDMQDETHASGGTHEFTHNVRVN